MEGKRDWSHRRRQAGNIPSSPEEHCALKSLTLRYCYYITLKINEKDQTFKIKGNCQFLFCSKRDLRMQLKTFIHIQKLPTPKRLWAWEMSGGTHSSGAFAVHGIWTPFCTADLQEEACFRKDTTTLVKILSENCLNNCFYILIVPTSMRSTCQREFFESWCWLWNSLWTQTGSLLPVVEKWPEEFLH